MTAQATLFKPKPTGITLRPYQQEAIDAVYRYFEKETGNPLIVLPAGTGKSLVIASFTKSAIEFFPETRILMLTHVKELIGQNLKHLVGLWPEAPVGVYSAGLGSYDTDDQILYAGIQSLHRAVERVGHIDIVVVDEAHLISKKDESMYGSVFTALRLINPKVKVVGLTATDYRLDSGYIHEGDDTLFSKVVYEADIGEMIEQGYLLPPRSKKTKTELSTEGVKKRGKEFIESQLIKAVNTDPLNNAICDEIIELGADRKSWLLFCTGIDHSENIAKILNERGISGHAITSKTSKTDRARWIDQLTSGEITFLSNANVLTTGFDSPRTDLIALIRPTESTSLYVQMICRGDRLFPGLADFLVLDFAKNVSRHGPLDDLLIKRPPEGKGGGEAPMKFCPECSEIVYAAVRICPACAFEFPPPVTKLSSTASGEALLKADRKPEVVAVTNIRYERHKKNGKPDSMRVTYYAGIRNFTEWVAFESAPKWARSWWWKRAPGTRPPMDVTDALARTAELKTPARLSVIKDGKYYKILSQEIADDRDDTAPPCQPHTVFQNG